MGIIQLNLELIHILWTKINPYIQIDLIYLGLERVFAIFNNVGLQHIYVY